jgi:hypothetical protein
LGVLEPAENRPDVILAGRLVDIHADVLNAAPPPADIAVGSG